MTLFSGMMRSPWYENNIVQLDRVMITARVMLTSVEHTSVQ